MTFTQAFLSPKTNGPWQIIVEKQVPLKELSEFLDEKWMPFAFLAITQCVLVKRSQDARNVD